MLNQKKVICVLLVLTFVLSMSLSSFAYLRATVSIGNLSAADATIVCNAMAWWNNSSITNKYVKFYADMANRSIANDKYCVVQFKNEISSVTIPGATQVGDIIVNTAVAKDDATKLLVVKHELGHVIGIGHNFNNSSIMSYELPDNSSKITSFEGDALKALFTQKGFSGYISATKHLGDLDVGLISYDVPARLRR